MRFEIGFSFHFETPSKSLLMWKKDNWSVHVEGECLQIGIGKYFYVVGIQNTGVFDILVKVGIIDAFFLCS